MKLLACLLGFCLSSFLALGQTTPQVVSGKIERITQFPSKYVTARNVDVWLPDGYSPNKKYAVLYMHDGQMLYDATTTWNKTAWEVDDVLSVLEKTGRIKETIVIGVWNGEKTRHADYFPQKPFKNLKKSEKEAIYAAARSNGASVFNNFQIYSDGYLKFLVNELKPYIDSHYAVSTKAEDTFVAGSSMGGLISMYAICEYPKVFGGAACLSTHWPGIFSMEGNPIPDAFIDYMNKTLPKANTRKIYFDYGDQTLDALYPPLQKQVDSLMKAKGYTDSYWMTKFYPGDDHSEKSWSKRLHIPLEFLLKK
jgi:enterochelin esterase-like enzyme